MFKTLPTLSTVLGLLSSVNSLVYFQVFRLSETLVTVSALVRFFSSMNSLVLIQMSIVLVKLFPQSQHT